MAALVGWLLFLRDPLTSAESGANPQLSHWDSQEMAVCKKIVYLVGCLGLAGFFNVAKEMDEQERQYLHWMCIKLDIAVSKKM